MSLGGSPSETFGLVINFKGLRCTNIRDIPVRSFYYYLFQAHFADTPPIIQRDIPTTPSFSKRDVAKDERYKRLLTETLKLMLKNFYEEKQQKGNENQRETSPQFKLFKPVYLEAKLIENIAAHGKDKGDNRPTDTIPGRRFWSEATSPMKNVWF